MQFVLYVMVGEVVKFSAFGYEKKTFDRCIKLDRFLLNELSQLPLCLKITAKNFLADSKLDFRSLL